MLTDRSRKVTAARPRFFRSALVCSSLAIAVALTSVPVRAQSFLAGSTTTFGNAVVTTGANTTTITISSPSAVIDWTPTDTAIGGGAITYQPNGTVATFTSASNFTVLNRIVPVDPTRAIVFDGMVNSLVNGSPGGTVFFYSPGGVILSTNAQFNVGNLGLTSSAPVVDGAGNWYVGNQVQFQASAAGRQVNTLAGSQINAPAEGSFIALVAPSISHRGAITVNGQAALVSADSATITFAPSGLFDIQVTSGTSATGTTLFNDGTITGPVSSGAGDNHRIYAVAVPKNTAITLAIGAGSNLGFNIAGAANVSGNAIVLSGGNNIIGGQAQTTPSPGGGAAQAGVFIGSVNVTSALTSRSTANTFVFANTGETATFASNLDVAGATTASSPNAVQVRANGAGANLTVAGNLTVTALDPTIVAPSSGFSQSRFAAVDVNDGAILNVSGALLISNIKTGGTKTGPTDARLATTNGAQAIINGSVTVTANRINGSESASAAEIFAQTGSTISIAGDATLRAIGLGIPTSGTGQSGGSGTGGVAILQALTGGDISVGGNVDINAFGIGGEGGPGGGLGGNGLGGRAQIFSRDAGSSVLVTGSANVTAGGNGGAGNGAAGGTGTGGQAFINAQVAASDGISIGGAAGLGANGIGGNANGGPAGAGFGGNSVAAASVNNTLQFGSALNLFANGTGGNVSGSGAAGSGTGGTARITLFSTGTISVAGTAQVQAIGFAGIGNPNSALGTGNIAAVSVQQNSVLSVTGMLQVFATGLGDRAVFGLPTNGAGIGGTATVDAFTNGAINVGSVLRSRADATSANGGNATAGTAIVAANSGGDITASQLNISADAIGGNDTGMGAGFGTGGTASLFANGAGSTVAIANGNSIGIVAQGELDFLSAEGFGGQSNGGGSGIGGAATGGNSTISVTNGATLTGPANGGTQSFVRIIARAAGGNANTGATAGGAATGGNINITVDNATLTSFNLLPSSFAEGGSATVSATGTINGGNAVGGTRNITIRNSATAATAFSGGGPGAQGGAGSVSGRGGDASGGIASLLVNNATLNLTGRGLVFSQNIAGAGGTTGNVTAGSGSVTVSNGGTISVPDVAGFDEDLFVGSNAFGAASSSGPGTAQGNVTAGTATLTLQNGTITGAGSILVQASAVATSDQYAQGGTYRGGQANVFLQGGSISNPMLFVTADAIGADVGAGLAGTAGSATGGFAQVVAAVGTNSLTSVRVESGATGGNILGTGTGGAGTGGDASLRVNGGAILNVSGSAAIATNGTGGSATGAGSSGAGGAGTGGNSRLVGNNGAIQVIGATTIASGGIGGAGAVGGAGGAGTAGLALINAVNNAAGSATIVLGAVNIGSHGVGGLGGAGASGGGAGGVGGAGAGGNTQILGGAGNGNLTTGNVVATALGNGGAGGAGGVGATGGAGGVGGQAVGGFIQAGTASFLDNSPTNTGSATFGSLAEDSSAFGGSGGAGGSGTTQGIGGSGGAAFGGGSIILVRGSPVTFNGSVTLDANAVGGNGGAGSATGAGGNATIGADPVAMNAGRIGVVVTNRFSHPEQPGRLTAGSIIGRAGAFGGSGSTPGATLLGDQPVRVEVTNSTATIASLDLSAVAATPQTGAIPSALAMSGSTASISSLSLNTLGTLSVALDTATLNTGTLTLSAGNFVLPATAPVTFGTINVSNTLAVSSPLDFLAYANFNVSAGATLAFSGSFLTGNLTFNAPLDISAGGSITTGAISASDVVLDAGQAILTAAVTTGGAIDLSAGGAITTGLLTAGDTIEADAGGALIVAGASAGIVNPSTAPLAKYNVGLRSQTSVGAGDVSASASFGVSSPGSISVGNVNVGLAFLALPGTSLTTGSIVTGAVNGARVYIANHSMEALGGQVAGNFDPAPIFAASPVATAGPITITGSVSTNTIQASTLQSLSISGTTLARGAAVLVAGTTLSAGDITVGDRAIVAAGGDIALGNVNAGASPALPPTGLRKIAIGSSSGTVTTGNLSAGFDLGIQAGGGISTGALRGQQILLLAGSSVSTGAISALVGTQPIGQLFVGNFSMANSTSNVFQPFRSPTTGQLAIFNLDPVRTGGAITFGGSVLGGNVSAAAGQGFTASAITASNDINVEAGGLASVNGAWRSMDIDIVSGDIAIASTGSLDVLSATGEILLASTNPNGMFVGDGLTPGSGYALSNDEFSRVKAGEIAIVGDDIAGLATDLTIGTLTINATQLYGTNGVALFASGNRDTDTPSGILRIVGAVTANGFAPTNEIDLLSGTVEIEAERGSLKVNAGGSDSGSSSSSSLGGLIFIEADHIHVASDAILTKLRADPLYTGHIDELNAPASVQRPDGVINALGFEIKVGKTFYIQNTGSRIVPAGFLTTFDNTDVFASANRSTSGVEIVINGQFQTSTGTLTGRSAFDRVIADPTADSEQFLGFSETSQLNGCVFSSGVCAFGQSDPVAAISSEIKLVTNATLDESPVAPAADESDEGDEASGDKDEDDNTSDEGSSPIAPPTPLISTRALDGDVNVIEPVSGAGNPALSGSAVNETTVQGEKP